jgi:15-cis-phytoene desaturase
MMSQWDCIIIGTGLAGLSCGFELVERGWHPLLLESKSIVGGRTASWRQDGMLVESGLHRVLGFYEALPAILKRAGLNLDDMVVWEDEFEIWVPDKGPHARFGAAPLHKPFRTMAGLVGNNDLIPPRQKMLLARFITAGLQDYFKRPLELDERTVAQYARAYGVPDRQIGTVLTALTAGLFFLPPERYSAYAFFGQLGPYLPRLLRFRVGAFRGGMTDVMCGPFAHAVMQRGGQVRTNAEVSRLDVRNDRVCGVELASGERMTADRVVVATPLHAAQTLLKKDFATHPGLARFFSLPSMPAITVQYELDHPATLQDRTIFGPGSAIATFSEQSRTTFRHVPGRLSTILAAPDELLTRSDDALLQLTQRDAGRLGIQLQNHISDVRVIRHTADFYSFEPGTEHKRPPQSTSIPSLILAGDYTKQPYLQTMEGAVVSGQRAAAVVLGQNASATGNRTDRTGSHHPW